MPTSPAWSLHSLYSDGPHGAGVGTCRPPAGRSRPLTDHDSLEAKRRGEEGLYGTRSVLVGTEVSPRRGNHYLAFGLDDEIAFPARCGRDLPRWSAQPAASASPLIRSRRARSASSGPEEIERSRAPRARHQSMPFDALDCEALEAIELWSFVTHG